MTQFKLRTVFAFVGCIALVLAYWRTSHERHLREEESLLQLYARSTETSSVIPPQIRPIVGSIAADFEVVTACEVMKLTHRPNYVTRDLVEELKRLRSLRAVRFRGFTIDAAGAAELSSLSLRTIDLSACDVDLQASETLQQSSTVSEVIVTAER